jgi:hypothetical protein
MNGIVVGIDGSPGSIERLLALRETTDTDVGAPRTGASAASVGSRQ